MSWGKQPNHAVRFYNIIGSWLSSEQNIERGANDHLDQVVHGGVDIENVNILKDEQI